MLAMAIQIFKQRMVGAINTCIRMINESGKYDSVGKGIIANEWKSFISEEDNSFIAFLTILNKEKVIKFKHCEWLGYEVNVHDNVQLNELLKTYS